MTTRSVDTALSIVEILAEDGALGLSEMARRLELSKATALRLLKTLEARGWVRQEPEPSLAWSLSQQFAWLGRQVSMDTSLREIALDSMNRLQLETTETVHLTAVQLDHLVLIERLDSPHELRAFFALGTQLPFHASASGLAYLSALPDVEVEGLLRGVLERKTERTLTDPEVIGGAVREVRTRGYSLNNGGLVGDISSVGAPLVGADGRPVGALSVSGPTSRLTEERRMAVGPLVVGAAREVSRRLARGPGS